MLYSELEGSTLEELIAAFRGPPLDGEEYRASFYDDVSAEIATRGGIDFLEGELDQDDEDRLAAVLGALACCGDPTVDTRGLAGRLRRLLDHPHPFLLATAICGLRSLGDLGVHDRVRELLDHHDGWVRANSLMYLGVLFPLEALPLLLDALGDADARVRFWAVDQLDELEHFTDDYVYKRMLDDPDEDVREHARYILENHFP